MHALKFDVGVDCCLADVKKAPLILETFSRRNDLLDLIHPKVNSDSLQTSTLRVLATLNLYLESNLA